MKGKVLIVDDEPIVGELINFQLSEAGFESVYIDSAVEALRQITSIQPDIIISDIIMPEMDGYHFHQKLRQAPETADIPFIFLTAKTDTSDELTGLALGVDDYIGKPPVVEILVKRISNALARAKHAREKKTQALFSGRLGQAGLHSYLQIITNNGKSGELIFYDLQGNTIGKIFFDGGVLANAIKDDLDGEDAFYELVIETEGYVEFYVRPIQTSSKINISSSTAFINAEMMLDKRNYLLASLPKLDVGLDVKDSVTLKHALHEKEPRHAESLFKLIHQRISVRNIIENSFMSPLKTASILSDLLRQNTVTESSQNYKAETELPVIDKERIEKDLYDALKRLEIQMATGILEIRSLPKKAEIHFKKGRIVHAIYGKTINRKALYRIFAATGGEPVFQNQSDISKNGMKWSLDFLLSEGGKEIKALKKVKDDNYRYYLSINRRALKQVPAENINPGMRHILPLVYQYGNIGDIVDASYMTDFQTIKYLNAMAKQGLLRASLRKEN